MSAANHYLNFLEDKMKRIFLLMILVSLVLGGTSFAQYSTFVVDDDGNPLTTYPTLAAAIATAQTFAGGPHKIVIMAGAYGDADLSVYDPTKIDEIYGDPAAAAGDIVFTSPSGTHNFMWAWNGLLTLKHFKLVGYSGTAIIGNGATNLAITDMIIRGASGTGIDLSGTANTVVDGLSFTKLTNGVYGNGMTNDTIRNCTFDSCYFGTQLYNFTPYGVITNLSIVRGTYGIYLDGGSTGAMVTNNTVDGMAQQGIYLNTVGGSRVENNLVTNNAVYGIYMLNSLGGNPNYVRFNCLINNTGGTSQGFDNVAADLWDQNYYSDGVFAQDGGAVTDLNPKLYSLKAVAAAASYNIGDVFSVDFNWDMPVCAGLDSVQMAAYGFTVTFDPTKLEYVPTATYDQGFLGAPPEALYTEVDAGTPGQLVFAAANFTTPGVNGARLASAQFKVIGANAVATIGFTNEDFRDPGNNPMNHNLASVALTLIDNVAPVMVSLTANNPALDDTYSDGSAAGPGPFLKLYLTMSATDNYNLAEFQWNSNGGPWSPWTPVSGTSATAGPTQYDFVWLGLGEGTHIAGVRVKDAGGNVSAPLYYTYNIDRTAPAITAITLADLDGCAPDPEYTNDRDVKVTFADDGTAVQMMLSESGDQPIIAYANPATFQLGNVDGLHNVWVRLYDKYNNRRDWFGPDGITLDRVAPTPVNFVAGTWPPPGPAKTGTRNITVDLGSWGGADVVLYKVSENAGDLVCPPTGWLSTVAFPMPHPFVLSQYDGNKIVNFASMDKAGNISAILSDQIELDSTPPVLLTYNMVDRSTLEDDCSKDGQIRAYFTYSGADATTLQWSYDGVTYGNWEAVMPSPDSADGSVTFAFGYQKLYIRLVDNIGNISNAMVDSIFVDGIAPTIAGVTAADNAPTATPDPVWPGVTNSTTFTLNLTGLSADVVALKISQDNGVTYADVPVTTGGAATYAHTYTWVGTPTQCGWYPVLVKTVDCAGNVSAPVGGPSTVYFDINVPRITAFTCTSPNPTPVPLINLSITASDTCGLYLMRLKDAANGPLAGTAWVPFSTTPSVTLATGDGPHTVNLEVSDYGGNIASASVVVNLDETHPSAGTFVIVSGNPLAAPGYTDALTGNTANITWDADVTQMYIRNSDGSNATGWIAVTSPKALVSLALGVPGIRTVQYRFRDGAGNIGPASGYYSATIQYSNVAPPPPLAGSAFGMPTGSCDLTWGKVAEGQSYAIRFNFQNQYPTYPDPIPPHPATFAEGILAATGVTDTVYRFEGPQPDIYSFSIWTLGKNGMWSATPNIDVTATNYILGDFSPAPDGCIKFTDEFGALAIAYNSIVSDPNFNEGLDIGPTIDAKPWSYPVPDQKIDFEDLVIFALNYDVFHCTTPTNDQPDNRETVTSAASAIAVEATMPNRVNEGEEFAIPVTIDNYQAVKGYHVVLDYNTNNFELVKVEAGEAYKAVAQSFFYYDRKSNNIDVSGVVFGSGVTFGANELFVVTLRARSTSDVNMGEVQLTFRDRENSNIAASLGVVKTVTLPTAFALSQNYPNPFNPTTNIELSLPVASNYKLTIYNVLGQEVESFEGHSEAGYTTITWNASALASGIYLYRVEAGSFTATRKMVLLK
ncbi:hypothetical protein C3F09_02520 [candidate division GN15 bacterium]|uniref:T9SS type A sorting domain-containing protein n=1 Tax=candidate division GN15 bacterium TaxID=2072418 RepID=A0A855XBX7_9BACT|nr:MAG: hypothetical protein C3F09_02520 [candidate division GN15 bacterium]